MGALLTGSNNSATTTVTIPAHNVGDLIVVCASRRSNATAPSVPSAGLTVPAWNTIDTQSGTTNGSCVTAYFVATATNHTSGTWTNATDMVAVVISGQNASPIGGHATNNAGSATTSATAPAVTLSKSDGTSILLHFFNHNSSTAITWGAAPAGYTRQTTGSFAILDTKDDTTSDGSVTQSGTFGGGGAGYACASVEVLAAPASQGSFFALF